MKKFQHSWFKNIKLIAWDLDGTLYPPMPEITDQIDQARLKAIIRHLQISEPQAEEKFRDLHRDLHSSTRVLDELGIGGEQFFLDFWHDFDLSKYIDPDQGLQQLFSATKAQLSIKYALLTNSNTKSSILGKLKAIGLALEAFSYVFASGETGKHKPEPAAFRQLWEETPFNLAEIIYVGDKENTDIKPAKKLGLKTALIHWGVSASSSSADLIVKNPRELLKLLTSS